MSDKESEGTERVVNTAVVGAGYWGRNYVRNLAALEEAELSWVCDADAEARSRARRTSAGARVSDDLSAVLEDPAVEALVVATNVIHHHAHTVAALRAGKHVLVEKPMAMSVEQAREMVELAEERQLTLMVGHLLLYHPAVERLREIVQEGELGRVFYMHALRVNLGRVRSVENALWSFAPHDLSVIGFLLDQEPRSVSARGRAYLRPSVADVVFVNLDYPDQTMAQIQLSWLDPHKERRLTVVGSKKMVVFNDTHAAEKLRVYDKGFDRPPEYDSYSDYLSLRNGDIHIPRIAMTEPLTAECRHFLRCVRSGERPRSCARSGLAVVKVLEAAEESMKKDGAPVTIS